MPRARDLGLQFGTLPTGPRNAITDVAGVKVGHATIIRGESVRTGCTAVLPHGGNLFREKVRGAVHAGNAFGKLVGSTQVEELGEIETPVLLTSTLNVWRVADAVVDYMLSLPPNEDVRSINPVVAETNDGALNDIRGRHVGHAEVMRAIQSASGEAVDEGAVGAGTGTICFGYKGGIGTASRRVGEWTVGVLAQTNFGGQLRILGVPVDEELKSAPADGSVIIVVATNAPVDSRNLRRMAARTMLGLARTGAAGSNGSGDYGIAFSTWRGDPRIANDAMSPLFLAVIEATEEAIVNSLFQAKTMAGNGRTVEALPMDKVLGALRRRGVLR